MTKKELTALAEACNRFFSQPEEEVKGPFGITRNGRRISVNDYQILEPFFHADVREQYKVGDVVLGTEYSIGGDLIVINGEYYVSVEVEHLDGLRRVIKDVFTHERIRSMSSKHYYKKGEVSA